MAENKIRLRIVTPTRQLFDKPVDMVIMRAAGGDLAVLHGHQPMTATLAYGLLRIIEDEEETVATVFGGFASVTADMVTVISDASEWPGEIDKERAESAKRRAEERIEKHADTINMARAELAIKRALVRLEATAYGDRQ